MISPYMESYHCVEKKGRCWCRWSFSISLMGKSNVGDVNYFSTVLKMNFDTRVVRSLGHRAKPLRFFTVHAVSPSTMLLPWTCCSSGHAARPGHETAPCACCSPAHAAKARKYNFQWRGRGYGYRSTGHNINGPNINKLQINWSIGQQKPVDV